MIQSQPVTKPLFSIGDLVKVRGFGIVLSPEEVQIGIISNGPYSFKSLESYHELVYFEWWCYDIIIGSSLITMMPENFLLRVSVDESEKDI
tara:strand:- start:7639 stop:7911 length:273 start_codon:yes stop_codon:yes gene_type:complete